MTMPALFEIEAPGRGGSPAGGTSVVGVLAAATRTELPALTVIAHGVPKPQGSKTPFINRRTGRAGLREDNPNTGSWRDTVAWAVARAMEHVDQVEPLAGPLRVAVVFTMPKPASRPKRRVTFPDTKPDIDKLQRAAFDAVTTAGGWVDDARVIDVHAVKVFPGEHEFALSAPGLHMRVWQVTG
jgi:Holliday junction resolvase RusA-like endonuclease